MTKLKTLKDIEERLRCPQKGDPFRMSLGEALRQEVIKWIKEDIEEHRNMFKDVLNGRKIISPTMTLINKWKERFNITEGDLE